MRFLARALGIGVVLAVIGACAGALALWLVVDHYGQDLPDYAKLADYQPAISTRIHAGDGRLLAEYARERRVYVPSDMIPERVKQGFVAAEDQNFYHHVGVDPVGILGAAVDNLSRLQENRRPRGASTITQQVAKNFLLTNEVSLERKIREALLAIRIERAFTKAQILELYLNEIYLGNRAYGVAAAALNYFNKSLDDLSLAEIAYLAGLPKAPSRYDPRRHLNAALERRDYVLDRMLEDGYATEDEVAAARVEPLVIVERDPSQLASADFFAEEVRRRLEATYGAESLYESGLVVHTTLDEELQAITDRALREGLATHDRSWRGWRGALGKIETGDGWAERLANFDPGFELMDWRLAVVLGADGRDGSIGFADGTTGTLTAKAIAWARPEDERGRLGARPSRVSALLPEGSVIAVAALDPAEGFGDWGLRQVPAVEGAIVALDPNTGSVLAMSGGFSFKKSKFNRASQARRQPGSSFKPFVYLAGLEHGYTPSTIIVDGPISISQGPGLPMWTPENYSETYYGPSTMRQGLEKSRNLMTVRLAQTIGMDSVMDVARRFGIERGLTPYLAAALGSNEVTLLEMAAAYGAFANGGKQIEPHLIERIQDRYGATIRRGDERSCVGCNAEVYLGGLPPILRDTRDQVADPRNTYQVVSMLQGVVQRGTATRAKVLDRPLAGKTGTTNDSKDTWFMGFSPDLVVGVYVGYDQPKSLGRKATGSSVALPIWIDVMREALADEPIRPFSVPRGVRLVQVDLNSGALPTSGSKRILEAFVAGTEPSSTQRASAIGGGYNTERSTSAGSGSVGRGQSVGVSAGGLY